MMYSFYSKKVKKEEGVIKEPHPQYIIYNKLGIRPDDE